MKTDGFIKGMKKTCIKTKNSILKMLHGLLGKIILILVFGIVILIMITRLVNRFFEWYGSEEKIVKTTITVEEIRKIDKLVTASFYEELLLEDCKKGKLGKEHYLAIVVRGTVKAGFDLSELSENDVQLNEYDTLRVNLPGVTVWKAVINFKDEDVIFTSRKKKMFQSEDEENLVKKGEKQIQADAIANGIKEKAIEEGKKELTRLLGLMGFDKVIITIGEETIMQK
jgi:hypothetical protein